jgi:autotransporter-associated beta strand protein
VLAERFPYMTNEQLLSVLKTTAVQNGTINDAAGVAIANPTAGQRVEVPDDRNGWGTINLRNAIAGPGQFTDRFAVDTQGRNDTWSNNISDTAIKARRLEDQAEAAQWDATKAARGWQNGLPAGASEADRTEFNVGMARELARQMRVYEGSLAKLGDGMLTLSGANSFSGGTDVRGGTLVAASATALGTGDVTVAGATLATRSGETVRIGGDLTLGAGSVLDLGLGFADGALLDVEGLMTFGGLLSISFLDGFLGVGLYDLIDFGSFAGSFSGFAFNGLSPSYTASLVFGSDGVALSVSAVPEPETYALMLMGLGAVGWLSRRRKRG